jgi:hypothetical protein
MLIDVTRRLVRIIYEECSTVVVIRTLAILGEVDGSLHQDHGRQAVVPPNARLVQGRQEFIETVLVAPMAAKQLRNKTVQMLIEQEGGSLPDEPYYAVSAYIADGHVDYRRLHFVFAKGPKEIRVLTLIDATHGLPLFAVQVPAVHPGFEALRRIMTPLQRLQNVQPGVTGLWTLLLED